MSFDAFEPDLRHALESLGASSKINDHVIRKMVEKCYPGLTLKESIQVAADFWETLRESGIKVCTSDKIRKRTDLKFEQETYVSINDMLTFYKKNWCGEIQNEVEILISHFQRENPFSSPASWQYVQFGALAKLQSMKKFDGRLIEIIVLFSEGDENDMAMRLENLMPIVVRNLNTSNMLFYRQGHV